MPRDEMEVRMKQRAVPPSAEWRDYWCDRCRRGHNGVGQCKGSAKNVVSDGKGGWKCKRYKFDFEAYERMEAR